MMKNPRILHQLTAALLLSTLATQVPAQSSLEKAMERYRVVMQRLPFYMHSFARMRLAHTRSVEALDVLTKDYRNPKSYPLYTRYTIAGMLGKCFNEFSWGDQLRALRQEFRGPGDAWLWANIAAADTRPEALAALAEEFHKAKEPWIRAAIIYALGQAGRDEVFPLIEAVCADFPKTSKKGERRLMVGAMSEAVYGNRADIHSEAMSKAIRAYINLLHKDVKLENSCKMVISRYLTKAIGKDVLYVEPEPWLRLLEQGYEPPKRSGQTVSQVRFFGLTGDGDRLCFLIDMSNSMLKPIDPGLLPKGPVTGPKKRRKRGQLPTEDDIPWHKVKTRWDLAREHVKIAIQRLDKSKRFCVMWFGDKAGTLKSTPGMVQASRGNVRKVMKELDSIRARPTPPGKEKDAPHGILMGQTNMHSGLRHAFALTRRGFVGAKQHEYVDKACMAEGCDTIFLLSDGAPSIDDFRIRDKDYGEGRVVREHEEKNEVKRTGDPLWYHGPMDKPDWLTGDVRRLNAFRKVQLHCVGVGEADANLLRRMAGENFGEVYFFGAKAKQAAGGR